MRPTTPICIFIWMLFLSALEGHAQINESWSAEEIASANTVQEAEYLNAVEKEVVIVLNLARLYPKRFIQLELEGFHGTPKYGDYIKGSRYKRSRVERMEAMKPMVPFTPVESMYDNAKCFAEESGRRGTIGHHRKSCEKLNLAECCSYGMDTGKEIVLQLLIDHDVPSLGHRNICLDPTYSTIGVGDSSHKTWDSCCVLVMI